MRTCNCGNKIDTNKVKPIGEQFGLILYNCEKCDTTLSLRTAKYYQYLATIKALRIVRLTKENQNAA